MENNEGSGKNENNVANKEKNYISNYNNIILRHMVWHSQIWFVCKQHDNNVFMKVTNIKHSNYAF